MLCESSNTRAVLHEGHFIGETVANIQLPALTAPDKLATFCKDTNGNIYMLLVHDHENEPHSIFYDDMPLSDSSIYLVTPINPVFLLIALFYQKSPSGDKFVNFSFELKMIEAFKSFNLDLIFDCQEDESKKYRLNEEKTFKLLEVFVKSATTNHITDRVFSIRWSITINDPPSKSLMANGLEMLRDLIADSLFGKFCKHLNMLPLSDSAISKKINDLNNPSNGNNLNNLKKSKKTAPEPVKAKPITDFFKPKSK